MKTRGSAGRGQKWDEQWRRWNEEWWRRKNVEGVVWMDLR